MIAVEVKVFGIGESKTVCVPSADMKMIVPVLVLLSPNACFLKLVSGIATDSLLEMCHDFLRVRWALGIGQEN